MFFRLLTKGLLVSAAFVLIAGLVPHLLGGHAVAESQEKDSASSAAHQRPSPTPKSKEEEILPTEDIIRTETNLTNIFFSAEDKSKRYISTLKQEDIRILEDGQPQQIFTFQQNTDLPLSLAILIDTSRSEERTFRKKKLPRGNFSKQCYGRIGTRRRSFRSRGT